MVFLISLILLILDIAYCIALQSTVSLELLKECTPMRPEEIWSHSHEFAEIDNEGKPILSEASQFGITDDECITTKSIVINTDPLWFQNNYKRQWKSSFSVDYRSILFLLIVVNTFSITLYTVQSMISHALAYRKSKLHTKCARYTAPDAGQSLPVKRRRTAASKVSDCRCNHLSVC